MSRILVDQIRSNSASADAITLDGSGNLTIPGNATISGTATGFGGGKILQVVTAETTTEITNTTTTFVSTGLSASITPSSASSKILITTSQTFKTKGTAASSGRRCHVRLRRGDHLGTDLQKTTLHGTGTASQATNPTHHTLLSFIYLDSPNTTSSTTYTIAMAKEDDNASVTAQEGGSARNSVITLFEVAA